jgi:N-acyl-D-glutamate deacylase
MMCLTNLAFASALVLTASAAVAQDYDTVILNGRVIDRETIFDDVRNVGIEDGKISIFTGDRISGSGAIDAAGACGGTQFHQYAFPFHCSF